VSKVVQGQEYASLAEVPSAVTRLLDILDNEDWFGDVAVCIHTVHSLCTDICLCFVEVICVKAAGEDKTPL